VDVLPEWPIPLPDAQARRVDAARWDDGATYLVKESAGETIELLRLARTIDIVAVDVALLLSRDDNAHHRRTAVAQPQAKDRRLQFGRSWVLRSATRAEQDMVDAIAALSLRARLEEREGGIKGRRVHQRLHGLPSAAHGCVDAWCENGCVRAWRSLWGESWLVVTDRSQALDACIDAPRTHLGQ
jgi:hypothetical protein